ncbi:MAG: DoxX family protein [Acidimicrobiales bacterium]
MSVAASVLSIVLFLVFATSGMQKIRFNPMMSAAAEHLGFSKIAYQRIGVLEFAGALGVLVGLASTRSSFLGVLNIAAAAGLAITMVAAVFLHLKKGDGAALFAPAGALTVLSILELIFRIA